MNKYSINTIYIEGKHFLSGGRDVAVLKHRAMGYLVKMQKVDRPTNRSFYVNFPVALAEALVVKKGEKFQWLVEDKNTLVLQRLRRGKPRKLNKARQQR